MKKSLLFLILCLPALGFAQTWSNQNSSISNDLEDVFFIDDSNGWAVGRQGKIVHTSNGGTTWAEENSGTTKDLNKVFMVSSSAGYAVGDGGTVIKYNGSGWSALNIGFSQDMYGVFFLSASTGWVSGDWGCIKMTTDGGANWTTQMSNSVYSNTFNDLYMLSASDGWAVGSSGKVLRYNGSNWSSVSNPASGNFIDLHAVAFSGPNDGFMTGENSSVYKWDGSSWNTQNTALSSNGYHVYDVQAVNSSLAYAATTPGIGGGGIILKYNGSTWVKDYEYTGMNSELFSGLSVTPNGNVFAVAAGGMIKARTAGGTATGIPAGAQDKNSGVYPNPFSASLTIDCPDASDLTLRDLYGRVLKQVNGKGSVQVATGDLPAGVYFYTLTSEGATATGKLVKQ